MPLSEFLRFARGKLESGQQKPCPTELPPRADDNFVELVWENGQVMMRGQSSRASKIPLLDSLPANSVRDTTASRVGKFGGVDSILNDISPVVPSPDLDLSQEDDVAPWLSYNIDDALPQNFCSGILPEISSVTNNFVAEDKKHSCDQMVGDLSNCGNPLKGSSSNARLSWPCQTSDIMSNISSNHTDALFGNSAQVRDIMNASTSMKVESQNKSNNSSFLNFPNFSRPAAVGKANLPNSNLEKMEIKEKGSVSNGSNLVKSTLIEPQNETDFHVSSSMCEMASPRPPAARAANLSCPSERIENLNIIKNDQPVAISNTAPDGERIVEPMVASSSVGSGNSADIVSCEQTHNSKRKFRDVEESECRSDDIETESVGVKKPTPGRGGAGSKRSRAAEVHNLSERRRRDRINEKMRALQELIPNCNKADKASMLDEAIEYLKTLQLQVQIMSMGAGLCMPPMMFPPGMQHMHPAHLPHFSSMGVGMGLGMRMGFGMGMVDMNGGSPIFPVPPMQGSPFPCQIPGPTNFPRIPGSSIPLYGHPGPELANSVPRAPLIAQPPVASTMGVSGLRIASQSELPSTSPILNPEDPMANKNCSEASTSINHGSDQVKTTSGVLVVPTAMQENKQATDVNGPPALASNTETDIRPN